MNELVARFDEWLESTGPAALVLKEHLMPVEGHDGVVFPATFAAAEDKKVFAGGYNIDTFPDGTNICLIDSIGSQANRLEPIFSEEPYAVLVPQVIVEAGEVKVNLLSAGHRAGDAIVRCSSLQSELHSAFLALQKGNALPLAKSAPTSLVFGVWDSRDTQAKHPRLIASTIRAYNVRRLTRSAQFIPAVDYVGQGMLEEATDDSTKKLYSERGFRHVPASGSHGGVIADGGIRREATLQLAALRFLKAGEGAEQTRTLRRYVLGLALTAFTAPSLGYLRQGCNLVRDPDKAVEMRLVHPDGRREELTITHQQALEYATAAAEDFGVGQDRTVPFDSKLAQQDLGAKEKKKNDKKGKKGKGDKEELMSENE